MMAYLCGSIAVISILFLATECQDVPAKKLPKLLVITYDGFKNDYFNRNVTPYFNEMKFNGIYADYMMNTFPSKTLPSHHTMVTGLYAEDHGVIDSGYYDVKAGKQVRYSYDLFHYNKEILPLWILNERAGHGRRSGVGPWPGAEFEYGGSKPTFARKWKLGASFKKRVDDIISWFNHPETPINLAMVYLEEPDHHGHYVGISNDRFNRMVKKADETTRYFHKRLNESGLWDDINIIHVGDHGMASVKLDRIIDLDKYVNPADYRCMNYTSMLCVFPLPGREQSVYDSFQKAANETKGLDVYWRRDIPERFHYSNNPRIGPILVLARVGYAYKSLYGDIYLSERDWGVKIDAGNEYGLHGYDNITPEMHTFFFGLGPAFWPHCKIQPFTNIDLFPLFCDLLEIQSPQVNGTLDVFKKCLRKYHT